MSYIQNSDFDCSARALWTRSLWQKGQTHRHINIYLIQCAAHVVCFVKRLISISFTFFVSCWWKLATSTMNVTNPCVCLCVCVCNMYPFASVIMILFRASLRVLFKVPYSMNHISLFNGKLVYVLDNDTHRKWNRLNKRMSEFKKGLFFHLNAFGQFTFNI